MSTKSQFVRALVRLSVSEARDGAMRLVGAAVMTLGLVVWPLSFQAERARGADEVGTPATRQTQPSTRAAGEPKEGAWWEVEPGWAKEVNGLRVRIDVSGQNARRLAMEVELMFWNVSEDAFALNLSDGTMRSWEVRDAAGKVVEPRETTPVAAAANWMVYGRAASTPGTRVSAGNRGGRLELDGRVWQLVPGKYTLGGTFSGPSKLAGKQKGSPAWEGRVEVPGQAFEVFGEPTAKEFKTAIAKARIEHADDAEARWRALAELVTPGMNAEQMQQALPSVRTRDREGTSVVWMGCRWKMRYAVDEYRVVEAWGYGVKAEGKSGEVLHAQDVLTLGLTEMVLTSRPRVNGRKTGQVRN